MSRLAGVRVSDVRGCARIVVDATIGVAGIVEGVHVTIAGRSDPLEITTRIARLVYGIVRTVTAFVGNGIDAVAAAMALFLDGEGSSAGREAAVAVLNGVLGDYLADTGNPLTITMQFRRDGQPLELETDELAARLPASNKVLLFVHGLCLNDLQWARHGNDPGAKLAMDLGYTPVYLHYNSGLHVSTNGRRFSALIETLLEQWPVPVQDLVIVGHSMGGLLARSAHYCGTRAGCRWPDCLRKVVFLGTPHHGTPLERAGSWVDAVLDANAFSAPFARLGKIRSAGITDLRFGSARESDWRGRDRFGHSRDCRQPMPLPTRVQCYAIAAIASADGIGGRLRDDGFVPADSALGDHADPRLALAIPESHRWIARGMSHLDLLSRPEVYERIAYWLMS